MAEKVKWIQYGTGVITFIGVLLTGVLWYDRGGVIVHAEDEAECAAAAWERSVVPFMFGGDSPTLTVTNIITSETTNYYALVTIRRLSGSAGPVCEFAGGGTNRTFTPENWDVPVGLAFSYDEGGFAEGEPPATAVFRFAADGYPDVDVTVSMGYPVSYGEFVTDGMIKVREWYKYQAIADVADQVSLFYPPTNSPTYTVTTVTNTYNWAGEIYKIDPYLRKGSDDSSTPGIQSIASLLRRTALYTGPLAVRWLDTDEDLPAHGDTIASGVAYWTNSSSYDNDGQAVSVHTIVVSNYTDAAVGMAAVTPAAYKWYWTDCSNYYDMDRGAAYDTPNTASNFFPLGSLFGFASTNAAGPAAAALTGNWWSRNGLGSNVWRYGHEYLTPSNDVLPIIGEVRNIRRSSFVTTNILNEMKTLSQGMTRTVAVIPAIDVAYTNIKEYSISSTASVMFGSTNDTGTSYVTDWDVAFAAAHSGSGLTPGITNGPGTGVVMPYLLIGANWNAYLSGDKPSGGEWSWSWYREWDAFCLLSYAFHYYGCSLPYPSMFALTNGYVEAVTIYSVSYVNQTGSDAVSGYYTNDNSTVTYSSVFPDPIGYTDIGFGYMDYVCGFPSFTQSASSTEASLCNVADGTFYHARVNLVGTWSNPVLPPKFDFGENAVYEEPPVRELAIQETFDVETQPDGDQSQYITESHYLRGIVEPAAPVFVVVVDWKWKHFNPTVPYAPTNFVPDWITFNTNKPHVN